MPSSCPKKRKQLADAYKPIRRVRDRKRKAAFKAMLNKIQLDSGCVDCGYNENPVALDFDHLPGSVKVAQVSHMEGYKKEKIEAEIAKCEVVCANCHRIRTYNRREERERVG